MLEKCDWLNIENVLYNLNSVIAPFRGFDVTVQERVNTSRNKSEQHGVYPQKKLRGGMEIHCEGDLFQDTSALYVAERKLLVNAINGNANVDPLFIARKDGTLTIRAAGEAEDWKTDCIVTAFSAPVVALYPAKTEFMITFFSWTPWFIGVTSGDKYYWS